jgi:peroxiredoxin family protein
MAGRVVLFVQRGSFEPAYQVATIAITAAAMGDEVIVVFAFEALRQLARGAFGHALTDKEQSEWARAEGLNVLAPSKMLAEARSLGVRLVACDTTAKLCGLGANELSSVLDEVMGLPSIWRFTQGARVLSF